MPRGPEEAAEEKERYGQAGQAVVGEDRQQMVVELRGFEEVPPQRRVEAFQVPVGREEASGAHGMVQGVAVRHLEHAVPVLDGDEPLGGEGFEP